MEQIATDGPRDQFWVDHRWNDITHPIDTMPFTHPVSECMITKVAMCVFIITITYQHKRLLYWIHQFSYIAPNCSTTLRLLFSIFICWGARETTCHGLYI